MSEQLDRTQLKRDRSDSVLNTVASELGVSDENASYLEATVNSYGYENNAEEGYEYPEDCEEGFVFCKKKKVQVSIFKWNIK